SLHDVIRGLDCGADNFIRKPFDGDYLVGRIRFILLNRRYRSEERVQLGMQISLGGNTHFINAERQQIFDLLISTYEEAIRMTGQLREQQQQIAHSYQSLEGLYRIAEGLGPAMDTRQVAATALARMLELPSMMAGTVMLYDAGGALAVAAAEGCAPLQAPCDGCQCGDADGTRRIDRCGVLPDGGDGKWNGHVSVPLLAGGKAMGVMNLVSGGAALSRDDCNVLDTAGKQVAIALERARLYAGMESLVAERTSALEAERNLLSGVLETTGALVCLVSPDGRIAMFNPACEAALGWRAAEVTGRVFWDLFLAPGRREKVEAFFAAGDFGRMPPRVHEEWRARDGSVRRILWSSTAIRGPGQAVDYILGTGLDVTELEGAREKVEYLSSFDAVTGLPNLLLLRERMAQICAGLGPDSVAGMLLVRCERLPLVRESLGLAAEHELLLALTDRLKAWKPAGDLLARVDDITFALVAERAGADELAGVARAVLALLDAPFAAAAAELHLEPGIGIAVAPADGGDLDTLLQAAQMAARRALEGKDERYTFYRPELSRGANERLRMEGALRYALERDQLRVHYQPQVDLRSGRIIGVEALLRWQHPELGMVPPGSFIALAEETGLILPIGAWVLRQACMQVRAWRDAGLDAVPVAVNLSARQFSGQIAGTVRAVLEETGIEPHLLELELTESVSMDDPENTFRILAALKDMGVLLAIDDFGTGYSNLNYLKRFPVDKLKLDQSFVRELTSDPDDLAIARAVIAMAHSLRLRVIAEGVETDGQLAILADMGCDEMQGYLFSKPVAGGEIAAMLDARRTLPLGKLLRQPYDRTLLFVDDEINLLSAMRRITRNKDYRVHVAATAAEAFEVLATNEVGVILCDQRMPGMSGTEFLARVKHLHPDTVRMVLSGYTDLQSVTDAVNHGAIFKFLTKPWDEDELFQALTEAFRKYEDDTRQR
ncbi:MAG: EAL domain-containing protein, partial [Telluria sp.]